MALNSHKAAMKNSKHALEKETVSCRGTVVAFGAFEELAQYFEAENASLKEVSREVMHRTFPPFTSPPARKGRSTVLNYSLPSALIPIKGRPAPWFLARKWSQRDLH